MKAKLVPSLVFLCLMAAIPAAAKTASVDCTKGQKVQDAVDKSSPPLSIEIHGICVENVSIVGKTFTLTGTNPATDGLQGVNTADPNVLAALTVNDVVLGSISSLSFSNGPRGGVAIFNSQVDVQNCQANGNSGSGMHVSAGSFVTAANLIASNNATRGVHTQRAAQFSCTGCRLENN
jgi:hypothetical protein